jgi:DNA-binding NarL/FixJ family response regulator
MKVLLVDDHPLILSALQAVIQGLGDDVSVFGVASADEARAALKRDAEFDLALMDLNLGDADGFDLLAELRSTYPALPVVVVSATERQVDVIRAIDMGAMGFVPKRASNRDLFEALRMVMSGGVYIPPMLGLPPPPGSDTVPAVMRHAPSDQPLRRPSRPSGSAASSRWA